MHSNRAASQLMTLDEVASHTGHSIESILSLAAEGSITLAVMYTKHEVSKLSPELRKSEVLFWALDRFQILEIINEGHVSLIPPGTLTGWIDEVGRPAERIDTPEEQSPRYKGKAKLVDPANVHVKIEANRLRVSYSEFSRIWQKESNRPGELETEYQKSKSKGGRPLTAHTILIRHFLQKHPQSTWSRTEPNFETWLRSLRGHCNTFRTDGREFEIRVEFDRDEKMYEFEVNGAESDLVPTRTIKERFNSVKKGVRKQSK